MSNRKVSFPDDIHADQYIGICQQPINYRLSS